MDASNRSECLPGTRQEIREYIADWAMNNTNQIILWIHGLAGSGKSTLATTMANFFQEKKCLGAFLFFNRDIHENTHPAMAVRTLAYQLGLSNSRIGEAINSAINDHPSIYASPLSFQFQKLIVEPLASLLPSDTSDIIVVVIDALDECGSVKERKTLLSLLTNESIKLPTTLRIIITSRADADIWGSFETQNHIRSIELDITTNANARDIISYFRHSMSEIRNSKRRLPLDADWPHESTIEALGRHALGLFVWASTAVGFIDGHDPRKRIKSLLSAEGTRGVESALDDLYTTALKCVGSWDDVDFVRDFGAILGVILVSKIPLSADAIDKILGSPENRPSAYTISLLRCVLSEGPRVRVLHPSFAEFLSNRERCKSEIWFIDTKSCNILFTALCLQRLDATLKRNICDLTLSPTSGLLEELPEDVMYASVHWIEHVCSITDVNNAVTIVNIMFQFLLRHLLHWLEAMSILQRSRETAKLLFNLLDWIMVSHPIFFSKWLMI